MEVGAGNGRLSADILRALRASDPAIFESLAVHLVEASPEARRAQKATFGDLVESLTSSAEHPPATIHGIVLANELLDAFPVHQVVMRGTHLREVYVTGDRSSDGTVRLRLAEGALSTPDLQRYIDALGIELEDGWRTEINLRAVEWMRDIARRLRSGFIIVIDYGHEARHLYSASHATGTLTTFSRHTMSDPSDAADDEPAWLRGAGDQDMTSHVDFTTLRRTAEAEGLVTLGFMDQTYFLMGLLTQGGQDTSLESLQTRLALKTLMLPGGLGSTHKVLLFSKNMGTPHLAGCSFGMRVT